MSAPATPSASRSSLLVLRLSRLRALPRRAVLDGHERPGNPQIVFYAVALIALGYPLGLFMARVYCDAASALDRRRRARLLPRSCGDGRGEEQDWKSYGEDGARLQRRSSSVLLYAIQRLQGHLFLNPDHMKGVPAHLALNTAASFVTNTNWQYYGGEYTMSYLTQMAGLAVQNFVSAAVGMAVLAAVVRGIARRSAGTLGNFWVDLYRSLVYILLPLAIVVAVHPDLAGRAADVPRARDGARRSRARTQTIARGPVASQIAIKQLGHERRRLLQLELGRPVREPDRPLELHRDALDPADPGGAGVHVREDGARATACVDGVRLDVRRLRARRRDQPARGAARLGGAAQLRREHHAGHGQSGGNMADKEVRFGLAEHVDLDGRDERRLERLGQRRLRRADARSAARCRSSTCSSAR